MNIELTSEQVQGLIDLTIKHSKENEKLKSDLNERQTSNRKANERSDAMSDMSSMILSFILSRDLGKELLLSIFNDWKENHLSDFESVDDNAYSYAFDDLCCYLHYDRYVDLTKIPDAETETKAEKPAAKEKSPNTYRTTYYNSSKSKVLLDRLGGDQSDIVLEFADAELSDEELKSKQRAFLSLLNNQPTVNSDGQTVQKKVAEKVIILFTMFKQKKTWNEVMYRTFKLLLTDGYIQSGDKGNLHAELLAKPYSVGTARAQAGQMMQMLPLLKIAKETSKGRLEINEDSTIVARLRAEYFTELTAKEAE